MSLRPIFHPLLKSSSSPDAHTRTLTAPEYVLTIVNQYAQGTLAHTWGHYFCRLGR